MIEATYIDHMGSDLSVVNAARVSFGKSSQLVEGEIKQDEHGDYLEMVLSERDAKLIRYLAKHSQYAEDVELECLKGPHKGRTIIISHELAKEYKG